MSNHTALACLVLAASLGLAGAAHAAPKCRTADLFGTWLSTNSEASGDAYCVVQFRENGRILAARCPDLDTLFPQAALRGAFRVKADCSVSGSFVSETKRGKKETFSYGGTLNPDRGLITGKVKGEGTAGVKYKYVKQW